MMGADRRKVQLCRWLIMELVAKRDSLVQALLFSQEDIFEYYREEEFEE